MDTNQGHRPALSLSSCLREGEEKKGSFPHLHSTTVISAHGEGVIRGGSTRSLSPHALWGSMSLGP